MFDGGRGMRGRGHWIAFKWSWNGPSCVCKSSAPPEFLSFYYWKLRNVKHVQPPTLALRDRKSPIEYFDCLARSSLRNVAYRVSENTPQVLIFTMFWISLCKKIVEKKILHVVFEDGLFFALNSQGKIWCNDKTEQQWYILISYQLSLYKYNFQIYKIIQFQFWWSHLMSWT